MQGKVFIIGLGLIGGSLALSIKKQHPEAVISGYDVISSEMEKAIDLGIIDNKAASISAKATSSDVIILSVPVMESKKILKELADLELKSNVIITDTGSTKGKVMQWGAELFAGKAAFIGGHPMAGSHKTGVENASASLFENAFYILTPVDSAITNEMNHLKVWLAGTNAHFLIVESEEHDALTAVVSHFPHIIAAALVKQAQKSARINPLISMLAAGGFRDITRIASSSPIMWKDIVKQNDKNILRLLDDWLSDMQDIRDLIINGDDDEMIEFFDSAKLYRNSLPIRTRGAIPSFYDLQVDLEDKVGAIAEVTGKLADHSISIANIQIIESREDIDGVLRLSFKTEKDRAIAEQLLQQDAYQVYEIA